MGQNLEQTRQMAKFIADLNRINQFTPTGSQTFTTGPDGRPIATTTLSPQLQALFNQQVQGQQLAGQRGQNMLSSLPGARQPVFGGQQGAFQAPEFGRGAQIGAGNRFSLMNMLPGGVNESTFGQQRDQVTQATFDRAMNLLNPQFEQQDRRREQDLANRGLPISGEAYQTDRSNTARSRGDVMNQLAMSAVLAGGQEQTRLLNDLLGTSQQGMGQAMANRQQRFGEALGGFGADLQGNQFNLGAAQANRQIPFNETLSLFNLGSGQPAQNFFAPGAGQLMGFQSNSIPSSPGGGIGSALGTAAGAGLGALFAAPTGGMSMLGGAQLGGLLGGGFGGGFGSLFG